MKKRTGRPRNQDGHVYKVMGVSGTQEEFDAVLDGLSARQRTEAMLDKIAAQAAADLWQPFETME